ncbi:hypothetical protein, partial [Pedobacter sp.]|uniref:hypothetical protein n=1 Tax=Pedobacter sp. TaxID=1411316 RepID=UPI003D7FFB3D
MMARKRTAEPEPTRCQSAGNAAESIAARKHDATEYGWSASAVGHSKSAENDEPTDEAAIQCSTTSCYAGTREGEKGTDGSFARPGWRNGTDATESEPSNEHIECSSGRYTTTEPWSSGKFNGPAALAIWAA